MQGTQITQDQTEKSRSFWPPNLRTKFTIGILILGIILAGATISLTYFFYRDANLIKYQRIVSACAQMAASIVDGDDVERYIATQQGDETYAKDEALLQDMLDFNDLKYIYVYMPFWEDSSVAYAFNIGKENDPPPEEKGVGQRFFFDNTSEDASIAIVREIIESRQANLDLNLSVSKYGALASAFVPLFNSAGDVVAVVGADVAVDDVFAELNQIILILILTILLIIGITIFLFQMYFTRTMIKPLQVLVDTAQNFVYSEYGEDTLNAEPVNINTRDELERLADAFNQMTEDIIQYIKDVTQLTNERERVAAELAVATKIQESALPKQFDIAPDSDFRLFATMDPAKEVGGDFYDFFMLDEENLCMVIGDVSGKGVPAALFMMMAKSVIRDEMLRGAALNEAFVNANNQLCMNNKEGMFVTVLCLLLNVRTGEVTIADAGHGSPIFIREGGAIEWWKTKRGLVMGGMEDIRYRTVTAQMNPGDTVFLFTDGVSEADNNEKELFGNSRIDLSLQKNWKGDLETLLRGVRADLLIFADGAPQADDITMLALQYKPHNRG